MNTPYLTDHTSNMLLDATKANETTGTEECKNSNKLKRVGSNTDIPNSGLFGIGRASTKKRRDANNPGGNHGYSGIQSQYISNIIGTSIGPEAHMKPKLARGAIASAKTKHKSTNFLKFLNTSHKQTPSGQREYATANNNYGYVSNFNEDGGAKAIDNNNKLTSGEFLNK